MYIPYPITLELCVFLRGEKATRAMRFFPLFLDIDGRDVLIVGGSSAAARKALVLAGCGAKVSVAAECPGDEMRAAEGRLRLLGRSFHPDDVDGKALVVSRRGRRARCARLGGGPGPGVPVNVVDRPALCTFIWPAIVDRDPVTVAISSGGAAPVLARHDARAASRRCCRRASAALARFAERLPRGGEGDAARRCRARRRFWERFFAGPIAERGAGRRRATARASGCWR